MPTKTLSYRVGERVVRAAAPAMFRYRESGGQHLPAEGGCIVVANHISHSDPFVVAHCVTGHGRLPRFLAKDAVFDVPLVGPVLTRAGQIPVVRESDDAAVALGAAQQALAAGECVVLYPEGTLTRDPDLWPMRGKLGAARLALATGCPVIPLAQWGSHELLPRYTRVPRLHRRPEVQVSIGAPVDLTPFAPQPGQVPSVRELLAATSSIMARLTRLLGEIRGETPPAGAWNPRAHGQPLTGNPDRPARRPGGRR